MDLLKALLSNGSKTLSNRIVVTIEGKRSVSKQRLCKHTKATILAMVSMDPCRGVILKTTGGAEVVTTEKSASLLRASMKTEARREVNAGN
jgi:hypothetical protein